MTSTTLLGLDVTHSKKRQRFGSFGWGLLLLSTALACVGDSTEHRSPRALRSERIPDLAQMKAMGARWTSAPTPENAALLARSYFPEFEAREAPSPAPRQPGAMLSVTLPSSAAGAMTLATRGHQFQVWQVDAEDAPAQLSPDTVFYGASRLWAPSFPNARQGLSWQTHRVEQFIIHPAGGRYRSTQELALPAGNWTLRQVEGLVEISPEGRPPVLRAHGLEVRDARGQVRRGSLNIVGAQTHDGLHFRASGRVRLAMEVELEGLEGPLVVDPGWSSTGSMSVERYQASSVRLASGKILVAGGAGVSPYLASAELYDPVSGTWSTTGSMATARRESGAALLPNGKVLVVGGLGASGHLDSAELFDPASDSWSAAGNLSAARRLHTTTALLDGRVLVTGGNDGVSNLASAEVYDPTGNAWSGAGSMAADRTYHAATVLGDGKVLVTGGVDGGSTTLGSAELYDPNLNSWSATGALGVARSQHTATQVVGGKVLVAGGYGAAAAPLADTELYDPSTGSWTAGPALTTARRFHTASFLPDGKVVIAGGVDDSPSYLSSVEVVDSVLLTASLGQPMLQARGRHEAIPLGNGKLLIVGGQDGSGALTSAETYDASDGTWTSVRSMAKDRQGHTSTLLPNGKVLVAGGQNLSEYLSSTEIFDPAYGRWTTSGSLSVARYGHTATLLPNGKVLVVGGYTGSGYLASAELYDPATGQWTAAGAISVGRRFHTATLLPNGKVLVAGGYTGFSHLSSAELYDPATGAWSSTGSLAVARNAHSAVVLQDGRLLVMGGYNADGPLDSAELYDPSTGAWSTTGSLFDQRYGATATRLANGQVLVAGGYTGTSYLSTAELYDPAAGTWSATGTMVSERYGHSAALLPNGKVLVAAGQNPASYLAQAELYDPDSGTWSATGEAAHARVAQSTTLLPSGKLMLIGGFNNTGVQKSCELYDSASGSWTAGAPLSTGRAGHTTTLLTDGHLLSVGGLTSGGTPLASAERFNPATGSWTSVASASQVRALHTATLLAVGKVLLIGGEGMGGPLTDTELYDAATHTWSSSGALSIGRSGHTATLLLDDRVLVVGGQGAAPYESTVEVYEPNTGLFSAAAALSTGRRSHTATQLPNGKVLVVGGQGASGALSSAELYDPATNTWTATGSLTQARSGHTATLLTSGQLLVAGGVDSSALASAEVYDPDAGTWSPTGGLAIARGQHSATVLPSGKILVAGGLDASGQPQASAELYDPATETWTLTAPLSSAARRGHSATLLSNGRVAVVGGSDGALALSSVQLYEDTGALDAWRPTLTGPPTATEGNLVTLTGTGFTGVSGASSGGFNDSTTNFPLVLLHSREGTFLSLTALNATATTAQLRLPFLNGNHLLWATVNGIPAGLTVRIKVAPVAHPQVVNVTEDTPQALTLTGTDVDGAPLSFIIVTPPAHGTLSTGTGAHRTYAPAAHFHGTDSFTFKVDNGASESAPATVSLVIQPVQDAPSATAQSVTAQEDVPKAIVLSGTDVDGDALTYSVVIPPANGTLTGTPPNLSYLAHPNFHGSDSFTFQAHDGTTGSAPATVSITVSPVNDAPTADAQSLTTPEETPLGITLTGADVESDPLSFAVATPPVHGTLSGTAPNLTYTPAVDFAGSDSFTFTSHDGQASSTPAVVSINVTNVNDAPVATAQSAVTTANVPRPIVLAGTDVDGDSLTFAVGTPPAHGALSGTAPNLTYTPDLDYVGADSFTFKVNDGTVDSAFATVSITVNALNASPTATAQALSTDEDTAVNLTLSGVDPEASPLSFTVLTSPSHGTLSGTAPNLSYLPNPDFHGSDTFTFKVNDGNSDSAAATVSLTVLPVNDAPVLAPVGARSTQENQAISFTLTATDVDSTDLAFGATALPAGATLDASTGVFSWTPTFAQAGEHAVTFTVSDGSLEDSEQVTLTVVNLNRAPTLTVPGPQEVLAGETLSFRLTGADDDGDALSFTATGLPEGASLNATSGEFSWTPSAEQAGSHTLSFSVGDGAAFATSTVEVVVSAPAQLPPPPVTSGCGCQAAASSTSGTLLWWGLLYGLLPLRRAWRPGAADADELERPAP